MDIEALGREEIIASIGDTFQCIEECNVALVGFEKTLRADIVAVSKSPAEPWVLAFEVKEPTDRWELKNWLRSLKQAGDYPNCRVTDKRAGSATGEIINASFLYPCPDLSPWGVQDSKATRFYRDYDIELLRGAVLLAQHFKVGTAKRDSKTGRFALTLGTDPVWDSRRGFRTKSPSLLAKRRVGSSKRVIFGIDPP